jgi:hypothetical protein
MEASEWRKLVDTCHGSDEPNLPLKAIRTPICTNEPYISVGQSDLMLVVQV